MGSACLKSNENPISREELLKKDPVENIYSSRWDSELKAIEDKYNILKKFPFIEYSYLLINHKTNDSGEDIKQIYENISETSFKNFLNNKLKNHYLLEDITSFDYQIFFDYLEHFYNHLLDSLKFAYSDDNISCLRKIDLIPLGLLYGLSHTRVKINLIYSLFSNDEGKIENNKEFKVFIFLLLSVPGATLYLSLTSIKNLYTDQIQLCDISLNQASESGDIRELMKNTIKKIFENEKFLTKEQFNSKIMNENWLLTPQGIRMKLDLNNIEREKRKSQKDQNPNQI